MQDERQDLDLGGNIIVMPPARFYATLNIHYSRPANPIDNAGGVLFWPRMKDETREK